MSDRTSIVVGTVGTVINLFESVDERLTASGSSWDDLAKGQGVSRQYLTRVLREPKMPLDLVKAVCRAVGLRAEDCIQPTNLVRSLTRGPGGGGSSDADADLREAEDALDDARAQLRARDSRVAELERALVEANNKLRSADLRRPSSSPQSQQFSF